MFSNLVESGSHAADLKRRGSFFVATLAFYGLLLVAGGVGSIYAYNVSLDDGRDELEIVAIMRFEPAQEVREEPRQQQRPQRPAAAAANAGAVQTAKVRELAVDHPNPPNRDVARADTPVLPVGTRYEISSENVVPTGLGSFGTKDGTPGGTGDRGTGQPLVTETQVAPTLTRPTPTPAPQQPRNPLALSSSVITGKAIAKPAPPYPLVAKSIRAQGPVAVQIVVDEGGRVISARATSGHPLLQAAAVQAAYRARFEPTMLTGQPVKVTGVITYNFVLQ